MCALKWWFGVFVIGLFVKSGELISTHNSGSIEMLWNLTNFALQNGGNEGRQGQGGYGLAYPGSRPGRPFPQQQFPNPNLNLQGYPGGYPGRPDPGPESVMDVLHSIASNDELHCVPKLLCELTSGSQSGTRQSSGLPFNINMESLLGLFSAFGPATNPLFLFGRAALLGYTSRGSSCYNAFSRCPTDPDKLVNYLNNYNGGFFRYFNGVPYPNPNNINLNNHQRPGFHQGPYQGSFQGSYQGSYQGPYQRPQSQFNNFNNYKYGAQQRILTDGNANKNSYHSYNNNNQFQFNDFRDQDDGFRSFKFPASDNIAAGEDTFYQYKSPKSLTFPGETSGNRFALRAPKTLTFPNTQTNEISNVNYQQEFLDFQRPLPNHVASPMIFPTRTGTGDFLLDSDEFDKNYYKNYYKRSVTN